MPINLSIRNVPDDVADRLRARAKQNHRSLQGELMEMVKGLIGKPPTQSERKLSIREIGEWVRSTGVGTPSESVKMIREDRDR
ncbi:MAG TPA: Arc family DNA-binding protein [Rhizomicrobium sp.]|jgi:plasmid stability protein|nr:Arc family DNA-binding protein [Rhizomicrobium sp.]